MISELILQRDKLTVPRFCNTLPSRDIHGGPFPPHGKLTQGLKILTAAIRNLTISRFLCEYSEPFGGTFSEIWLDMLSKVPVGTKCLNLVRIPRDLLITP